MKVEGKLIQKFDTQVVSDNFKKREFVLEYAENPMYPQEVIFQLVQDRCDLLNDIEVGQQLEVVFNLKGRKWNSPQGETKWFNSLEAWQLNPKGKKPAPKPSPQVVDVTLMDDDDDLPF